MQRVGVRQPLLLGQQVGVLAAGRLDPLDLLQAAAQLGGFPGALLGPRGELGQLGPDLPVPLVGPLVVGEHGGVRGPGEPVERVALPPAAQQLLLVGLAVHGDQVVGQVGQQGQRHRAAARAGPRPALG